MKRVTYSVEIVGDSWDQIGKRDIAGPVPYVMDQLLRDMVRHTLRGERRCYLDHVLLNPPREGINVWIYTEEVEAPEHIHDDECNEGCNKCVDEVALIEGRLAGTYPPPLAAKGKDVTPADGDTSRWHFEVELGDLRERGVEKWLSPEYRALSHWFEGQGPGRGVIRLVGMTDDVGGTEC